MTAWSYEDFERLSSTHGDSWYLLDPGRLVSNLREMTDAFRRVYPNTKLAYSYKTNYVPVFCEHAHLAGAAAEVVSKLEYDLARRLGIPAGSIIYNGPAKAPDDVASALLDGALVNVDSLDEVAAVAATARTSDAPLRVGARCSLAFETRSGTRFGLDPDNGELDRAVAQLQALDSVSFEGLHCHSSEDRSLDGFRQRAEVLVALSRRYFGDTPPRMLDLGGGFFGDMPAALRAQFDVEVPTYAEYAEAVGSLVSRAWPSQGGPELVLEPGVGVLANTAQFVCKVLAVKEQSGRRLAVTSGSVQNIKASPSRYQLPIEVISHRRGRRMRGPLDIVGYTCMEDDTLFSAYDRDLGVGDYLVFSHVGAYSNVFTPRFIREAPAMLTLWGGELSLARRRETLDDWLRTYAADTAGVRDGRR